MTKPMQIIGSNPHLIEMLCGTLEDLPREDSQTPQQVVVFAGISRGAHDFQIAQEELLNYGEVDLVHRNAAERT